MSISALAALAPKKKQPQRRALTVRRGSTGRGDYSTLDVVALFTAHGMYGRDLGGGKHAVLCIQADRHSDRRGAEASDTVIYEAGGGAWPGFHCSHAHCQGIGIRDVIAHFGDADRFCAEEFRPAAPIPTRSTQEHPGVTLADFRAFMPEHKYIFIPNGDLWPAASVNARIPPIPTGRVDENGKPETEPASRWLDREQPVEQMTWAPGEPALIEGRLINDGGWISRPGCTCFNRYRPPQVEPGDPGQVAPWWHHLCRVYGEEHGRHILAWLAHRVQRPGEKVNHALVLGGAQGIGKDTLLDPVKYAIGAWNFVEVSPVQLLGRFNGFVRSVILRVSEARDLGELDRFAFYEHTKTYTASPPDVLRCDEKNTRECTVFNCCGVIFTTNHRTNGIYLPDDDRRHFVAWSELTKDDFPTGYWSKLWGWYEDGGRQHVAAYLASVNLTGWDPKAPPPRTDAWRDIVDANRAPEDGDLSDVVDALGRPEVLTKEQMLSHESVSLDFKDWLRDRKNARQIPHRLEAAGYVPVRNDGQGDGRWRVAGKNVVVYGLKSVDLRERLAAVRAFTEAAR